MGFSMPSFLKSGVGGDNPVKAQLLCLDKKDLGLGKVQFNPSEFSYSRSTNWSGGKTGGGGDGKESGTPTIVGAPYGVLQFTGGNSDTLSVTLLFDESELRDSWKEWVPVYAPPPLPGKLKSISAALNPENKNHVLSYIAAIHRLTLPIIKGETDAGADRPPFCAFVWGSFYFQGVITSVNVDFKLFDDKGEPRRATAAISMSGRAMAAAKDVGELASGQDAALKKESSGYAAGTVKDLASLIASKK